MHRDTHGPSSFAEERAEVGEDIASVGLAGHTPGAGIPAEGSTLQEGDHNRAADKHWEGTESAGKTLRVLVIESGGGWSCQEQ